MLLAEGQLRAAEAWSPLRGGVIGATRQPKGEQEPRRLQKPALEPPLAKQMAELCFAHLRKAQVRARFAP